MLKLLDRIKAKPVEGVSAIVMILCGIRVAGVLSNHVRQIAGGVLAALAGPLFSYSSTAIHRTEKA